MNIVVMGGSFNPPTIAHFRIMQAALDLVDGEKGYFVPVSFPYLKRKMIKAGESHLCLSDGLRVRMLEAMGACDPRIRVFTEEMDKPFSDNVGLMGRIQERNPGAGVYYISGADKLELLENFAKKTDFFDRFRCILFARDCGPLREEIAGYAHLEGYQDAFILARAPEGTEHVSSTRIREHLFDIDTVADMLHPAVVSILRGLKKEDYPPEILQFRDEYAFLSNDYPAEVAFEDMAYPCAASAFLASRFDTPAERAAISCMDPVKAKQRYSGRPVSAQWEERKAAVMEQIVRLKFAQHPELLDRLRATGSLVLINGVKKDSFWGVNLATWTGENRLGQILMKIRSEEKTA